jgi:arginase
VTNRFLVTPFVLDRPSEALRRVAEPSWRVNTPTLPEGDDRRHLSALHGPIADFVAGVIGRGERPVSVAGDCCTAIGVLAGLRRAGLDPVLIWLDAHGDFNTWETTPSGFLGGMPLAMLVGRGEQTLMQGVRLAPIAESRVVLTDARDLDPGERDALRGSQVIHLSDPRALVDDAAPAGPLWVHFDSDVVNPDDAPAMRFRVLGGPSAGDLHMIFRWLAQTARLCAVSMTAWDFSKDGDGRTRAVCLELLRTLVG